MSFCNEQNISLSIYDNLNENYIENNVDLTELLNEISNTEIYNNNNSIRNDEFISRIISYKLNYKIKDLLNICDYYGITKDIKNKNNKFNKEIIINFLIAFESNPNNTELVNKRQNMWFYINELKNDKFMKKYVLW
jgi:hypothetical protein